jgi:hypothetical protein
MALDMGGPMSGPRVYGEIYACTVSNVVESPRAMIGALMGAVNTLIVTRRTAVRAQRAPLPRAVLCGQIKLTYNDILALDR